MYLLMGVAAFFRIALHASSVVCHCSLRVYSATNKVYYAHQPLPHTCLEHPGGSYAPLKCQ
ncbi:hypothetical protein PR003_g17439 [Phytophthora rubi]|uniref:Secreted protein n=1 Tax=Phytophthora rubi TaxID=129364 RepID=A0A6A4EFD2_9STRA|nr:hypothetical protein PF003_g24999 [Phytophthora fragariae]KAE9008900.1 hypothetical protein PR001_g16574 [Phytophthora rubi]KAE9321552.1 hypothetical protein PR003_g17439 [Phytophthora rubi]